MSGPSIVTPIAELTALAIPAREDPMLALLTPLTSKGWLGLVTFELQDGIVA